jgi:hypothetical protein
VTDFTSETADAYAERVDKRFRHLLDQGLTEPDERERLIARHAAAGFPLTPEEFDKIGNGEGLSAIVLNLYESLIATCPPALKSFCADHVRVRGVPSFTIEGAVFASHHGNYCVVVTTALMIFLSKVKKFIFAEHDLSIIEHCNRYPVDALTLELLHEMRAEVVANYRRGEPRGPILLLDLQRSAPMQIMLAFQERFIVAHEIGHLLADFLLRSLLSNALHPSFGPAQHRSEFMADLLGFALTRLGDPTKAETSEDAPWLPDTVRISAICEFFEILEMGRATATLSHPAPYDRSTNILATFFGDHFADHYRQWRSGQILQLDWRACVEAGIQPSLIGRTIEAMLTDHALFQQLVDLVSTKGADALKEIAAGHS